MPLPYEHTTSGDRAIADMQKILRGFGASSFGVMDDFAKGDVIVQFEWRGRQVSLKANAKGYAAAWLREHPHSYRMRASLHEHEKRALAQGQVAVYSILRDWIKGQITAVEIGIMSFDGAFLGALLLPTGETLLERVTAMNLLALPQPEDPHG